MSWKGFMKKISAISVLVLAVSGCDQISGKVAEQLQKSNLELEFSRDLSSPDNALKSWWRFLDATEKKTFENCERYFSYQSARENYYSKFTAGDVLSIKVNQLNECKLNTYSRSIQEVMQETETRAIALATIKNTTPSSLTPTEDEKIDREKGSTYRYLIEKDKGEWKISQVSKLSTYSFDRNDPWKPEYKRYPETFPSRTYISQ